MYWFKYFQLDRGWDKIKVSDVSPSALHHCRVEDVWWRLGEPRGSSDCALCRCSQPGAKLRGSAQATSLRDKSEALGWHLMPDWPHDPAGWDLCLGHVQSCDPLPKWWLGDSPYEAASTSPSDACSVNFCLCRIGSLQKRNTSDFFLHLGNLKNDYRSKLMIVATL